ncbi:MAG: hypothetical protein O3B87_00160 [bacterium]|nr:hypothetical protein [bacterium]
MNKGSMYVVGFMGVILLLVVGILLIMQNDYKDQTTNLNTSPSQEPKSTNPDYGDLTEEHTRIVDQAIGELLNSGKGVTPPMITVLSFTPTDFPDSSLGCPQPDAMYAQVITPGYQVILAANGSEYDYRVAGEQLVLCK